MDMGTIIKQARELSKPFRVTNGGKFRLKDVDPRDTLGLKSEDKPRAKDALATGVDALAQLQDMLYAQDRWAVLAVYALGLIVADAVGRRFRGRVGHGAARPRPARRGVGRSPGRPLRPAGSVGHWRATPGTERRGATQTHDRIRPAPGQRRGCHTEYHHGDECDDQAEDLDERFQSLADRYSKAASRMAELNGKPDVSEDLLEEWKRNASCHVISIRVPVLRTP